MNVPVDQYRLAYTTWFRNNEGKKVYQRLVTDHFWEYESVLELKAIYETFASDIVIEHRLVSDWEEITHEPRH